MLQNEGLLASSQQAPEPGQHKAPHDQRWRNDKTLHFLLDSKRAVSMS